MMRAVRDEGLTAARHLDEIWEVRVAGVRVIYRVLFAIEFCSRRKVRRARFCFRSRRSRRKLNGRRGSGSLLRSAGFGTGNVAASSMSHSKEEIPLLS